MAYSTLSFRIFFSSALTLLTLLASCVTDSDSKTAFDEIIEQDTIRVGAYRFNVRMAGPQDGPLVILLHGFPQTSYSYRHQLVTLADAGYRAVAPDMRGYSPEARPKSVEAYRMEHLVSDVIGIADVFKAQRFDLVGHDWGAAVGWTVAATAPDRVKSFTALSIPHLTAFQAAMSDPKCQQDKKSAYIQEFVKPNSEDIYLKNDRAGLRMIYRDMDQNEVEEYLRVLGNKEALGSALNWYRANFGPDAGKGGIGKVKVKTLFVWGAQDPAVGACAAQSSGQYVDEDRYEFKTLPDSGHWLLETDRELISSWILNHIKG
ncbi:alpha/beta fold hydrolase [Pseudobacteriovorax antillogorgiicola]|uniref:Pimeloyl-ACP methyl ester carboxylesterase n=1 Tax=Pseudobacteriovorax antillogorgiicola TaxID=1513793 RepID=A0A1Y6BC50_9BACT|nr:alpha/beta hydrolase [Pseudobacteriovorax antillogorgiicola]TCS57272.1 pimeloyl-ACP methyl ester carboxylesterase [Pseudobacteriovorax antillogorgiicola]SMF03210.1 Pimeloyl-ACP methyl ester carboxylesterase [Pseudobacteriovorax antillogorgiicola]